MILQTNRVILRPWREEDAAALYRYAADPAIGPPAGWPPHTSVENSRHIIKTVFSAPEVYAVCRRGEDTPIGCVGLHRKDLAEREDEYELGYWLGRPFWGQGLIPEAAAALVDHAFLTLGMRSLWCGHYEGNQRSRRVMEKLGFRHHHKTEGIEVPLLGEIRTGHAYLLTREEYLAGAVRTRLFASTKNTRPLPMGGGRYIRSDVPTAVTEGERRLLLASGVTLVIDLRTEGERTAKPCPLAEDGRFAYECYPLAGGDRVPATPADVSHSYRRMVDATFRAAVKRILQCDTGALCFCNAGKDRTGVLSAALLYHLGADRESILCDYMKSRDALREFLSAYAEKTGADIHVITPHAQYIADFLAWYAGNDRL